MELKALLAAPNTTTWSGRRDQLIMLTMVTTGLRVSELVAPRWADIPLHPPSYLNCHGKGRKDRSTP
ncbi:tyrosine-type recombinase/integrase [Arthrobacter alpinus]|uniref:tyrosine-type recombinase/integrase n=1 Tax=Arthrobacter alpinus TaxID=656366 RepID=UPI0009E8512A